jgi:biopolymer transport protein ExbD
MASHKRKGMPHVHGSEVNVTPLIDVIMCLIIFFMLVAKIGVTKGNDAKVNLPYAYLGVKVSDMGNTFTLNVLPLGQTENKDAPVTEIQVTALVGNQAKDLPISAEIGGVMQYPLRETLRQAKALHKDQFKVIIRADGNLPFTQVQKVLIECANVGASSMLFAAQKGTEPVAAQTPAAAAQ